MKIQFNLNGFGDSWGVEDGKKILDNVDGEAGDSQNSTKEKRPSFCSHNWGTAFFIILISILMSIFSIYFFIEMTKEPFQPIGTFDIEHLNFKHQVQVSWLNCGATEYGKMNMLIVEPSPISLKNNLTLSIDADVFQNIEAPITVKLTVKKKIWFKMLTIPCIDSFGSCTYEDVCQYSPYPQNSSCILPLENSHLPCNCPVEKGNYYANKSVVRIVDPLKYIPKWLKYGTYSVEAKIYSRKAKIGCYKFHFGVRS